MNGIDYLIIAIVAVIFGGAIYYIFRAKKQGQKCIGCAYAKTCSNGCSGCSGKCGCNTDSEKK